MRHSRRLMSPCDADRHWTLAGCALCHGESKPGALGWLTVEIQSAEVFMIATKSPAPYLTTGVLERSHAGSGRSEERRVGREGGCRWSVPHYEDESKAVMDTSESRANT